LRFGLGAGLEWEALPVVSVGSAATRTCWVKDSRSSRPSRGR